MTNGDYNAFFRHEQLSNDRKQAMLTMVGLAIAAVIAVALILIAIR